MKEIEIHFFFTFPFNTGNHSSLPPQNQFYMSLHVKQHKIKVKKMLLLVLSWDKLIYILMLDNHPHKKNKLILTIDIKK